MWETMRLHAAAAPVRAWLMTSRLLPAPNHWEVCASRLRTADQTQSLCQHDGSKCLTALSIKRHFSVSLQRSLRQERVDQQSSLPKKTPPSQLSPSSLSMTSDPPVQNSEKLFNLPNILTASRILSVPFLGHLILTERLPVALALLFVAGCTDLLDGHLARRWQAYTIFGSVADPAADKLLMTVMVASLGWKGLLPGKHFTLRWSIAPL